MCNYYCENVIVRGRNVVDRRSFGSRGVGNSNSDCYITCSRPEGIFVNEWVMGEVDFC